MKQLGRKLSSVQNESFLPKKTNEKLITKNGEQKIVVEKTIGEPVKSVATCFLGMAIGISRSIFT